MTTKLEGSVYVVGAKRYLCVVINGEAYITVRQLADLSNYTQKSIRNKIKRGTISMLKLQNGRVLIRAAEVDRLISDGALLKNISA